jgi:hypothetical protein
VRRTGGALVYASTAFALLGVLTEVPWLLGVATILACAGMLAFGSHERILSAFTPSTLYIIGSGLTALANTYGLLVADTPLRSRYFLYAREEHLGLAMQIGYLGTVLPVLGFRMTQRGLGRRLGNLLPSIRGDVGGTTLLVVGTLASVVIVASRVFSLLPASLGSITSLLSVGPSMIAFALARYGNWAERRGLTVAAVAVAFLDAARALFFSYVRIEVALPIFAVVLGAVLGARSLRPLKSYVFLPVHLAVVLFVFYFGAFGAVRSGFDTVGGIARLTAVREFDSSQTNVRIGTVFSRLTTFNQLSQVGRVVAEDGFHKGSTMSYLSYVFVPRFLWPDKPTVAKGSWFAYRIGQARILSDGRFSNAINMTVPGELYLNFGWIGVAIGCALVGALLGWLWNATEFWRLRPGALRSAFGFYLLFVGFGLGADLQTVVTLIAMYILFVLAGWGLKLMSSRTGRMPEMSGPSRHLGHTSV